MLYRKQSFYYCFHILEIIWQNIKEKGNWVPFQKATCSVQFSSVQWLSHVRLFATPWIAARQAYLSITNSWSLLKLMSIELVMPSSHIIFCHPLLLLPPIPPSIRVFSNESTLRMRWPKYWSFNFSTCSVTSSRINFDHVVKIEFRAHQIFLSRACPCSV